MRYLINPLRFNYMKKTFLSVSGVPPVSFGGGQVLMYGVSCTSFTYMFLGAGATNLPPLSRDVLESTPWICRCANSEGDWAWGRAHHDKGESADTRQQNLITR